MLILTCFTPFPSGYGSAAVSTSNLLSEDSLSIRSISVDDSPEGDGKSYMTEETSTTVNNKLSQPANAGTVSSVNQTTQVVPNRSSEIGAKSGPNPEGSNEPKKFLTVNERFDGGSSSKSVSGDESANEGSSVVSTKLPPGKVSKLRSFARMSLKFAFMTRPNSPSGCQKKEDTKLQGCQQRTPSFISHGCSSFTRE